MARTSPCFYISPTAISVTPNANGSASDLAVNVVKGAKIKVYSQGLPALGYSDVSFQQWTLTGRNRRLADSTKPYTIYARLAKNNKEDGYLVFAPKEADGDEWLDKYAYVTINGLASGTANKNSDNYWYVKLGDVSQPADSARTVELDTGILGTDRFNTEWNLDPDQMPLRIELTATIESKDAGDKPYVAWGEELVLQARLLEGWANANVQRFHHFTIQRNTGETEADVDYNYPYENSDSEKPSSGRQMPNGNIALAHARGADDVFNGTVSSTWTVIAWGIKTNAADSTSSSSSASSTSSTSSKDASSSVSSANEDSAADIYEKLVEKSINIMAETAEQYTLEFSSSVVNYDPSSDIYNPSVGVDVMVRATDQKGEVFKLTNVQLKAASIVVQYSVASLEQWNDCDFTGADTAVAKANIPIEAFHLQQNVNVRIVKVQTATSSSSSASSTSSSASSASATETTYKEIYRSQIALVRNGEDSKEREWIFLRSASALRFADTADDKHKLLPSLITGGEVKPEESAAGADTNKNQDGWVPEGWWDNSQGTDNTYHYEYSAYRDYIKGSLVPNSSSSKSDSSSSESSSSGDAVQRGGRWGDFSTPCIWSYYAEDAVSYRCRWTLAGVEVYQLKSAYTGAFRGTLPLVATLMKRVGSGQEQVVSGETVITLACEGIDYSKTFNAENPTFTISTSDADTSEFVQYLNSANLASLSASFTVNGEEHKFSIPVIREADEDSVKETIKVYGDKRYLSKLSDDTAQGLITFAKGLVAEMAARLKGGATFGSDYAFDADGNVVVNALNSLAFDEALQKGFGFRKDASTGKYTLSVTDLMVWGKAVFNSLEIRKLYAVGGNVYLSGASSKLQHVVEVKGSDGNVTGWKCYILADDGTTATQNGWAKYDQAKCQTFDIQAGTYEGVSNTYYWRLVTDVSTENEAITETVTETSTDDEGNETTTETTVELYDGKKFSWIILSKSDCESSTDDEPKAGDTIVLDGHRQFATGDAEGRDQYNDASRTNVMMLETTGTSDGTLPRIVALTGITDYKHSESGNAYSNTVFILSPKEVVFVSGAIKWISASGDPITFVNFRGAWAEGTAYTYYDQVSHNNSIWTCIAEKGTTTTLEPTEANSTAWRMEITGKGDKGEDAVTYTLEANPGYIRLDADGSIDYTNGYTDPGDGKNADGTNHEYMVVRGYKTVGGVKDNKFATDAKPITCRLSFNDGDAYFEYTAEGNDFYQDEVNVKFDPVLDGNSMGSLPDEVKANNLKSARAIMYEGEEYSADKILATLDIPIVKDGKEGESYGVSLTIEKRTTSSVTEDCLVVTFTKSGTEGVTTTENVQVIGGYAQVYVDGTLDDSMTSRLNLGTSDAGELMKSAYPEAFTAGYVTVKWYDKEGGTLLGMGSLTRGKEGEAATTYEVQVSSYSEYVGSGRIYGLQFQFVKITGSTRQTVTDVREIGCMISINTAAYIYTGAAAYINEGNSHFLFSSYPVGSVTMDAADNITVKMYLSSDTEKESPVAVANFANGKQGTGAFEIIADPETIVIDSDDNGLASDLSSASAALMCLRDGKEVSGVTFARGACVNCAATVSNAGVVTITSVKQQTVNGVTVSCTSGSVTVNATDPTTKNTYTKTIPFAVNVSKLNGSMIADNKKFETVYNELTNNGASTDLTWYESKIEQTARNISLKVQEKTVGRRNLLTGSALRKQEGGFKIMGGFISINDGYEGTNCVHVENTYSGSAHYYGAFWDGSQGGSSIKIDRAKKYVLTCWVKCDRTDATICLETLFTDKQTSATRVDKRPKMNKSYFKVTAAGTWELLQAVIDPSLFNDGTTKNTQYEYMAVNVYCTHTLSGVTCHAYICRPMLEEGDEYNGWTLSEQDYDYVGGNLLDNTGTLTKSGNLTTVGGTVTQNGMGESASLYKAMHKLAGRVSTKTSLPSSATVGDYYACTDTWRVWQRTGTTASDNEHYNGYTLIGSGDEMLHNDFMAFSLDLDTNEDYILSWYAKGNGRIGCYFAGSGQTVMVERSDGTTQSSSTYGELPMAITSEWRRYWVHVKKTTGTVGNIIFRQYRDDDNTASEFYISQPKLEAGATMTEWTEKRADMVDKQALLATGIDIENKKITLTANNTTFQDNNGNELAVIDQDGLHASKISTTDTGIGHTVMSGNTTIWYQKDGTTPGIQVFYDAAGVPHFQFCGTDGKVKYDFGPSGLQSFINDTQSAYSDTAYLHKVTSVSEVNGKLKGLDWCYVAKNASADECYIYRKQIPTTDTSSPYNIYDGCVFKGHKYSGTNWPSSAYLLPDGWYVEPNGGYLPSKLESADDEAVYDPTKTVYYQTFCYYSSGKMTRRVRAYMTLLNESIPASRYLWNDTYDEL